MSKTQISGRETEVIRSSPATPHARGPSWLDCLLLRGRATSYCGIVPFPPEIRPRPTSVLRCLKPITHFAPCRGKVGRHCACESDPSVWRVRANPPKQLLFIRVTDFKRKRNRLPLSVLCYYLGLLGSKSPLGPPLSPWQCGSCSPIHSMGICSHGIHLHCVSRFSMIFFPYIIFQYVNKKETNKPDPT